MKVAVPLAINILAPVGITAAASAIDAGIQKKIHASGTTSLTNSNIKMNGIMKSFKFLNILIFCYKESLKQLKMKQKNEKEDFIRYFRSKFARKHVSMKRNCESWF